MKKFLNILLTIVLFIGQIGFSYVVVFLLNRLGLNINGLSTSYKLFLFTGIDILFMLILFFIYRKDIIRDFNDFKTHGKEYFLFGFKIWILSLIGMIVINNIIYRIYFKQATNEVLVENYLTKFPLYMLFSSCIYAPFVEEIIYRKSIKNIFENVVVYILVSGLVFGAIHTLGYLDNSLELLYILPYGLVGAAFAYVYSKTDNIFTTICLHGLHNLLTVILFFVTK